MPKYIRIYIYAKHYDWDTRRKVYRSGERLLSIFKCQLDQESYQLRLAYGNRIALNEVYVSLSLKRPFVFLLHYVTFWFYVIDVDGHCLPCHIVNGLHEY